MLLETSSYRLGHQRRLKYVAPPDINTAPKQPTIFQLPTPPYPSQQITQIPTNFYNPLSPPHQPQDNSFPPPYQPSYPEQSPQVSSPPTPPTLFYNPSAGNPQIFNPSTIPSPSAPPVSRNSSQGSSVQNSFRSSPIQSSPRVFNSLQQFSTPPQPISSHVGVPATPQNTPAAESGFSAYHRQHIQNNKCELEAIQEAKQIENNIERTFTPISAATVTEKLEYLIAQQSEDDTSSEVAKLTSNDSEELAEIDLSATRDDLVPENQSNNQLDLPEPITLPEPLVSSASYFSKPVEQSFQTNQVVGQDPFSFVKSEVAPPPPPSNFQSGFLRYEELKSVTEISSVYGLPPQPEPLFFNPSQFSNSDIWTTPTESGKKEQFFVPQDNFRAMPEPSGTATLSPVQTSANPMTSTSKTTMETVPPSLENLVRLFRNSLN